MSEKYHRMHIRITKQQYARLKKKSSKAKMTMNKYLINELITKYPRCLPMKEPRALIAIIDEVGRDINDIAYAFNAGYDTVAQLKNGVRRMIEAVEFANSVRQLKEHSEESWICEVGCEYAKHSGKDNSRPSYGWTMRNTRCFKNT